MKILHISNNLGSGGSEKLLTDILPLMKAAGHDVQLAYANDKKNLGGYQERLHSKGIPIINFNCSTFHPVLLYKLIRLLKQEQYDVVHAHIFPTQYWLALASYLKARHTVLIKTEHNVLNNRRKPLLRPLEQLIYGRYACVIAVTEEVKTALQAWLGNNLPIEVVQNGLNLEQISAVRRENHQEAYDFLRGGQYALLMTGRFNGKAKDQQTLIQALRLLPERFQLYFAGAGELMNESRDLAERLGLIERVHYLGLRTDVYKLMQSVDLNVLSTRYEGLSGVTLEGLASGKPFLGADVPGVNNIVPDGRYLFPAGNVEALAARILAVAENPSLAQAMVQRAQQHVQQYDVKHMAQHYIDIYERYQQHQT